MVLKSCIISPLARLIPSLAILLTLSASATGVIGQVLQAQSIATVRESFPFDTTSRVPQTNPGQKKVTLILQDSSIKYAITELARQAGLQPVMDENPELKKRITVKLNDVNVLEAFQTVLRGTGLQARITSNGTIVMIRTESDSLSTTDDEERKPGVTVTGRVIDSATGNPLPGASIRISATSFSTISSERGTFSIPDVQVGTHSVVIRLVGYRSITRSVVLREGERSNIVVALSPTATMLAGVVTSVTGMQRKIEVGNDITVIDVDSVLRVAPVNNVTDILEGRVPGLTVMRSSGIPGAPSRIRLRGVGGGLLTNLPGAPTNDPIVVVDGIRIHSSQSGVTDQNLAMARNSDYSSDYPRPSPIDQIDPNSIEMIEVLKGPSAAALYGSDAANGVIVITTKRGQAGSTKWTATLTGSVERMAGYYANPGYYPFCSQVLGGSSYNTSYSRLCDGARINSTFLDSIVRFQALNETRLTPFGTGHGQALSATVSGGANSVNYSITVSGGEDMGMLKAPEFYQDLFKQVYDSSMSKSMKRPNSLRNRSITAGLQIHPRPDLAIKLSSGLANTNNRQSSAQMQLPVLGGSYLDTTSISPGALIAYATQVRSGTLTMNSSASANWNRWQKLPITTTLGLSRSTNDNSRLFPRGFISEKGLAGIDSLGFYSSGSAANSTMSGRINGVLMQGQRLSIAVGTDITDRTTRQVQIRADSLTRGVTVPTRFDYATQYSYSASTGGWFIEPRLNLNSRFFVNPGFRLDGNSLSGARSGVGGGLWSLFPKLNLSWIALDQEGQSPYLGFLSMVRPRVSVGIAGVQPAPGWQLRLMQPTKGGTFDHPFEDGGLEVSTIGNTQLRPERTREIEAGFDADLWDGRVRMSVTGFVKVRSDAIQSLPIAASVYGGTLDQYSNIGEIRNTGTEFSFQSLVIDTRHLSWSINASFQKTNNKLISLNNGESFIDLRNGNRLVPGYPVSGRWVKPIIGYSIPSAGGRLAMEDVIIGDSAVYVGQQFPDFELPFNTSFSLIQGQISLSAFFHYKNGLTQFNSGNAQLLNNIYLNPQASMAEQAAALAASCRASVGISSQLCTDYGLIQNVNSIRFSSISISYNVPRGWVQRIGVPSMSVSMRGSNLGLWTNYRGKDPDVNGTMVGDATEDSGQIPQPRKLSLQVRIGN